MSSQYEGSLVVKLNVEERLNEYGLTRQEYEECMRTIIDKKNKTIECNWQEIIDKYNLPICKDALKKATNTIFGSVFVAEYLKERDSLNQKSNSDNNIAQTVTTNINKDGSMSSNRLIEMNEKQSKDPEYLLNAHGFDPNEWSIVSARNTIRQVLSKQDGTVTLYASYITARPRKDDDISFSKIEEIFNRLDRKYISAGVNLNLDYDEIDNGDKLLLINIADLHLNLQATMFTTGNEYNCEIAEKLFNDTISDILHRTRHYNFKEIVFCIGGDMSNSDNLSGTTTKGTVQNNDIHYYDAYERLCLMIIKTVDTLRQRGKVRIVYVPGNHDEVTGFKLAKFIQAWYRNDKGIIVDYSPLPRKYVLFGKTLMCFAHDGDLKRLPMLIANEQRDNWAKVDTTEVFLQHLHTEQVLMEENNIRIQRLPTISGKSKWTNDKGYNSKRQCKSFIFDFQDGLTDVIYTSVKSIESRCS